LLNRARAAKKIFIFRIMTQSPVMYPPVNTRDATSVAAEVRNLFLEIFPGADDYFITRAFDWVLGCFEGRCNGYLPIDARYHDLEHTLQGTLCLSRLLRGRHSAGAEPKLTRNMFELGLLAILLHDTGYLKRVEDVEGTGAKYTLTHVRRSAEFAATFLSAHGYIEEDIIAVQNMIRCTGVNVDLGAIPFTTDMERMVGCALGTADLLAQMAAPDYVDKLPVLYSEFNEAVRFSSGQGGKSIQFKDVDDLISNTPAFWRHYVWPKVNEDFGQLYRFLNNPLPDGPNPYIAAVRANVARIERGQATSPRLAH
jgi:hypothetical protein